MNIYDIDFSGVKYFILDEADRMLDMGFYDDIMTIVRQLPKDRQTIMFSATMPENIRRMAKAIMRNPVEVQIAVSRPPETIRQMHARLYEAQKPGFVQLALQGRDLKKVIIFAGKKQRVKELARTLRMLKIDARAMHSDLEQHERDQVMLDFRNAKIDVLVATDMMFPTIPKIISIASAERLAQRIAEKPSHWYHPRTRVIGGVLKNSLRKRLNACLYQQPWVMLRRKMSTHDLKMTLKSRKVRFFIHLVIKKQYLCTEIQNKTNEIL